MIDWMEYFLQMQNHDIALDEMEGGQDIVTVPHARYSYYYCPYPIPMDTIEGPEIFIPTESNKANERMD